jgi:hypothetical protein
MLCKASIAAAVAFMLGSASVVFAVSSDGETVPHRNHTSDERAGPTSRHPQADPPFPFACTTDGRYRVGCDW